MKRSLQKIMLMALLLLVGSSAWADVGDEVINASIDFSTPVTDGKVVGTVNEIVIPDGAGEIRGESGWLSIYDGTSTVTIPTEERASAFDAVNVQFKMAWGNKKDMGSGFTLKDAEGEPIVSFQLARWCENGTNGNTLGIDDIYDHIGTHFSNAPISDRYTLFDITIDYATRKITTVLTCMNPANTATYVVDLTNTNPIATFNLYGYNVGGNTDRASVVDDILIKTIEGDANVAFADYTIKFVDQNGDQVKESVVRNNIVGESVEVKDEEKATFVVGNTKYVYVSDDAEGKTIAEDGSTVVTVTFQKVVVSEYIVNYLDAEGNALQEATTHKEIEIGAEVSASAGELSKILIEGVIYDYVSGNNAITVAEDASKNVINLVFAPAEGITGYYLATYEDGKTPWTTSVGGRFDPTVVDGSTVPVRYGTKTVQEAIVDEEGNPVLDEEGNPTYKDVTVADSTVVIEFANKTNFASVAQGSRGANTCDVKHASLGIDQADYTFEARLLLGSSNDQAGTNFLVKNLAGDTNILEIRQIGEKGTTTWTINGETTVVLPNSGSYTGGDVNNYANYSWYDFKVTVYKGYTFVTITDAEGNAILDKEQVATSALTYGVGALQFTSSRAYANFGIDDILVRSVADDDVPAGFSTVVVKVNYVDAEGNTLKPADTIEFAPGDVVSLTSVYTSDFKVDAEGVVWTSESENAPVTKYIYVSDNSEEVVAEAGAEVTVVFRGVGSRRVAVRYQYQDAETGEMKTTDAAGKNLPFFYDSNVTGDVLFEGDVQRIYHPYYLLIDGYLYKADPRIEGNNTLYCVDYEVPVGTNTLSTTLVTWTPVTEMVGEEGEQEEVFITNAVFAEESENIPGMTVVKDQYTTIRQANGAAGSAIGGDVLVTTLEPGKYTITTASRSGTTNFLLDGEVVCTVSTSGTVTTVTSEEFEVTTPTALYIQEQSGISQYSDYVLIRKTGDATDVPTDIVNVEVAPAVKADGKYLENGQIVIYRGGVKYNAAGAVIR